MLKEWRRVLRAKAVAVARSGIPTRKDRFTALDTLAVVRELRALERPRVDKAFDLVGGGWSIAFRVPGEGRRELLIFPGRYAALLPEAAGRAEVLSPIARELRRLLTGAILRGVAEPGGERFLELHFGRGDEATELLLAVELFGSGNLIVARDGRIAAVSHPRQWAHRSVRVGAPYARPPSRIDPWSVGADAVESELRRSRTDLASTVAARLGLGGPIAEELIARAGLAPEAPAAHEAERSAARLHAELSGLLAEIGTTPRGYVYRREGVAVDATPYASHRWRAYGAEESERSTFSDAAHEYFATLTSVPPSPEEAAASERRRELERLAGEQERAVADLAAEADRRREDAEAILAHYAEAEAAVAAVAREPRERRVEVILGGRTVSVWADRSPRESAQSLFEEVKRVQSKLAGARAALAETARRRAEPIAPSALRAGGPAGTVPARGRTHWFERYRWFISSEGAVVVGGRDAASNDLLVKRHLKDGDVYVHADLHGAASVIVKHAADGAAPVTEVSYREASQWAVAFSKAWRAGLASASAFWATPEQVTKSGASGEFVARGAWVIHGTKHFFYDLPTELALGTIVYAGETRWTVAPPDALRRQGAVLALLAPGDERERGAREVELVQEFGVPRTLLQSLLPAGGLTVRRP